MFVSFLVPVYNVEKYLEKCLEALLVQKGCPFEILLLDDGSTDSSGAICNRYAENYPDIVRVIHKENEGLLVTRRRGFREARGDWFICVDSDDFVAPDLLERVVRAAEKTGADMVMYNFEYFYPDGSRAKSRLKIEDGAIFEGAGKQAIYRLRLLSVDVNMMWMRAMKREIVDIDADYSTCGIRNMCEDAVQVLPLYTNAKKIVYLNVPLYAYRKGSDSITGRRSMASWDAERICFAVTCGYLTVWDVPEAVSARFYTRHLELLMDYVRWLVCAEPHVLSRTLPELVAELKQDSCYALCREHYRKEAANSRYLSMLVPVLTYLIEKENINGIRLLLGLERQFVKLKKR